jgi:hypothetical protein
VLFCDQEETIQHLFIQCPYARIIWQIVYLSFNISSPLSIAHMFGNWLNGIEKHEKANIRVGVCAVLTVIWHVRNNFIFNKSCFPSFLQVIPLVTHWIRTWSYLQPAEQCQDIDIGCNHLAMVARDIYSRLDWRFDCRLTCWSIGLVRKCVSSSGWSMYPPYVTRESLII